MACLSCSQLLLAMSILQFASGVSGSALQEDQQETARLKRIQDRAGPSLSDTTDEDSEADDILEQQ